MRDKLRAFIQAHRHAFDRETPDAHGWKSIEHQFERLKTADELEKFVLLNRVLLDTELPSDCVWENIGQTLNTIDQLPAEAHSASAGEDCDSLEQFIRVNRDALDEAVPDLRVWSGIEGAIPAASPGKAKILSLPWKRSILRVAASIALLLTGMGLGLWYAQSGAQAASGMAMSEISDEYAELEQYYQRDIAGKQVKLASFSGSQGAEVQEDLEQMNNMMNELRHELAGVPPGNREQVVRAMIENYKARASILQRVLEHLEKSKTETNNSSKKHEIEHI